MDLVRKILLALEASPAGEQGPHTPTIEGYSEEEVRYHIHLMGQADLLKVVDFTMDQTGPQAVALSVTWKGHDFADASNSSVVWEAAKKVMTKAGAGGIDVMVGLLKEMGKQKLKELGFDIGA
jgi:hypothetical protein